MFYDGHLEIGQCTQLVPGQKLYVTEYTFGNDKKQSTGSVFYGVGESLPDLTNLGLDSRIYL